MTRPSVWERAGAWAGLVLGPIAWAADHQFGSTLTYGACNASGTWLAWAGIGALLVTVGGGAISWRALHHAGQQVDRFIAMISLLAVGLFSLAILFQIAAPLVLPPCAR